ncbi:hypothetical protein SIN09_25710 [Streptomyces sp. F8]|nr:hypothetical protein [Streptomyces sp. F8]MDX6762719.1 hypothetical protein [Streptomyces sp. F8]
MISMLESLRTRVAGIELLAPPTRLFSNFANGHATLKVRLTPQA